MRDYEYYPLERLESWQLCQAAEQEDILRGYICSTT